MTDLLGTQRVNEVINMIFADSAKEDNESNEDELFEYNIEL